MPKMNKSVKIGLIVNICIKRINSMNQKSTKKFKVKKGILDNKL